MDRNKKIFIFILIFLVAISIAFIIYYFFLSSSGEIQNPPAGGSLPTTSNGGTGGTTSTGENSNSSTSSTDNSSSGGGSISSFKPILRQVTTVPSSGGIVFDRDGKTYIRYMERAKGNVYETDARSIKSVRLSNTTIPQIYETYWNSAGTGLVARFLKDKNIIQTFSATVVPKGAGEGELRGEFLTSDIKNLVISPSGTQIAYLVNNPDGASGIIASFDGRKKFQIFDSFLKEWVLSWPKEDTVTVTSKAGVGSAGLMMFIDANTGKNNVILSGINGLTTLTNSDGSKVLYSISSQNSLSTKLFDETKKSSLFFPLTTLPEKCVWSRLKKNIVYCAVPESLPSADYPDSWYQGVTAFRDEIWKIDTEVGASEFIMNLGDQSHTDFDAFNLSLSKNENFILLTNKNDMDLWELQIAP